MPNEQELVQIFNKFVTIPDISKLSNVLFVGPHPDDIEFGCGGLISKIKENGGVVRFLIITDGSAGTDDPNITPAMLKEIRVEEAKNAAKYLKADSIEFGELEDGGTYPIEDATRIIAKAILKYFPSAVFAPDPHLNSECHSDHLKVGEAARQAVQLVGYPATISRHNLDFDSSKGFPRNIILGHYFTDNVNCLVELSEKNLNDKIEALKLHKCQMVGDMAMYIPFIAFQASLVGKAKNYSLAEEFEIILPLCQHVISSKLQQ